MAKVQKQTTIAQKALNKSFLTQGLMHEELGEFLKQKHILAKAISNSEGNDSYNAKFMYGNVPIYTGKLKEYFRVDSFRDIKFVELNKDRNRLYIQRENNYSVWDINSTKEIFSQKYDPYTKEYLCDSRISDNGKYLVSNKGVWDIDQNHLILSWDFKDIIEFAFIDNNKVLVNYIGKNSETGDIHSSTIEIWNIETKKQIELSQKESKYIFDNKKNFVRFDYKSYLFSEDIRSWKKNFTVYSGVSYTDNKYEIFLEPRTSTFKETPTLEISKYTDVNKSTDDSFLKASYSLSSDDVIGGFFLLPIIIPELDVVILSGLCLGNSNSGASVIIDKMKDENNNSDFKGVTYSNQYNINDIFLSKDREYLISYTPNQINITKITEKNASMIQLDTYVNGVKYLKNGFIAYWYANKISIIKKDGDEYKEISTIYNITNIIDIFYNTKENTLMVIGESSFAKWDISMIFNPSQHEIVKEDEIMFRYYDGEKDTSNEKGSYSEGSFDINISEDKVMVTSKDINYTLEHNLLHYELEAFDYEATFAKLSKDFKLLLSISCYKGYVEYNSFCKLYLTDIFTGIHLIKTDEKFITQTGFIKNNDGIYIEYDDNHSKIYSFDDFKGLDNRDYPLKTTVETATEYNGLGELKVLTPDEWRVKKDKYEKVLQEIEE